MRVAIRISCVPLVMAQLTSESPSSNFSAMIPDVRTLRIRHEVGLLDVAIEP